MKLISWLFFEICITLFLLFDIRCYALNQNLSVAVFNYVGISNTNIIVQTSDISDENINVEIIVNENVAQNSLNVSGCLTNVSISTNSSSSGSSSTGTVSSSSVAASSSLLQSSSIGSSSLSSSILSSSSLISSSLPVSSSSSSLISSSSSSPSISSSSSSISSFNISNNNVTLTLGSTNWQIQGLGGSGFSIGNQVQLTCSNLLMSGCVTNVTTSHNNITVEVEIATGSLNVYCASWTFSIVDPTGCSILLNTTLQYQLPYAFNSPAISGGIKNTMPTAVRNRLYRIAWVGDSVSAGNFASSLYQSVNGVTLISKLANYLQYTYGFGDGGQGFLSPTTSNTSTFGTLCYSPPTTSPVSMNPPWTLVTQNYYAWTSAFQSTNNGDTMTYYAVRGSNITVYYFTSNFYELGGSFNITSNGVFVTSINTTGTVSQWSLYTSFSFLVTSGTLHDISIIQTGTLPVIIAAVAGHNPTGVVIDNYSIPGASLAGFFPLPILNGQNIFANYGGSNADVVVISMGLNDPYSENTTVYINNLITVITAYQALGVKNILVVLNNAAAGTQYATPIFESYRTAILPVSLQYNVTYVDLNNVIFPDFSSLVAMGFYPDNSNLGGNGPACHIPGVSDYNVATANVVHPSDIGQTLMAGQLIGFIRGCVDPIKQLGCPTSIPVSSSSSSSTSVPSLSSSSISSNTSQILSFFHPLSYNLLAGDLSDTTSHNNDFNTYAPTTVTYVQDKVRGTVVSYLSSGLIYSSLLTYPKTFTICQVVYPNATNAFGNFYFGSSGIGGPNQIGFLTTYNSVPNYDTLTMTVNVTSLLTQATSTITLNQWSHICTTFDLNGTTHVYINGVLNSQLSTTLSPSLFALWNSLNQVSIDMYPSVNGNVSSIFLADYSLSSNNISVLYSLMGPYGNNGGVVISSSSSSSSTILSVSSSQISSSILSSSQISSSSSSPLITNTSQILSLFSPLSYNLLAGDLSDTTIHNNNFNTFAPATVTYVQDKVRGTVVSFLSSGLIYSSLLTYPKTFTLCLVTNPSSSNTNGDFYFGSSGIGGPNQISFLTTYNSVPNYDTFTIIVNGTSVQTQVVSVITLNQWCHVCIALDSSGIGNVYVNAIIQPSLSITLTSPQLVLWNTLNQVVMDIYTLFIGNVSSIFLANYSLSSRNISVLYSLMGPYQ